MKLWTRYRQLIEVNTLVASDAEIKGLSYWRNKLFSHILLYLLPVSFIALIPGVIMSVKGGIPLLAVYDILAILLFVTIALYPRLRLSTRKTLFVISLYLLAVILLIYLGSFGQAEVKLNKQSRIFTSY